MRVGALQDWPTLRKAAATPAGTARARSASGRIRLGDLPPSSWATRFTVGAAAWATSTPALVEPVIEIMSTSGCAAKRGADLRPIAVHQVEHTRRDAGVVHHLGKEQGAQGRQLAGLQNDRASRCQGGADLGRDLVERPVPGRDQAAHADGLAHDRHVPAMGDKGIAARIVAGHADVLGRRPAPACCAPCRWQRPSRARSPVRTIPPARGSGRGRGPAARPCSGRNSRTRSRRRAAPQPPPQRHLVHLPARSPRQAPRSTGR